jgi:uncharacterized membrane protein YhiD involved in acid resistance
VSLARIARVIGIVAIFGVVGSLSVAALVSLLVVGLGASILQLIFSVVDLDGFRSLLSIALWLLAFVAALAALLPSLGAGIVFALCAVYAGLNTIWMAWLAAAVGIAGFISLGTFIQPSESSALILPGVRSLTQALSLSALLAGIAVIPASLCWWFARPLHRGNVAS